jgi:hypothetical protein
MASPNRWGLALLVLVGSFPAYAAAPRPVDKRAPLPAVQLRFRHEPAALVGRGRQSRHGFRPRDRQQAAALLRARSNPLGPVAVSAEEASVDSRRDGPVLEILPGSRLSSPFTPVGPGRAKQLAPRAALDRRRSHLGSLPVSDDGPSGSHGFAATAVDSTET